MLKKTINQKTRYIFIQGGSWIRIRIKMKWILCYSWNFFLFKNY